MTEQTPSPALRSTTPKDIEQRAREILGGRPLLIVSNREPYEHVKDAVNKITCRKTIGGLVSALDPLMQALHGTWIAWGSGSGDRSAVDSNDVVMVPPRSPTYALKRIWLTPAEVQDFYEGHGNQMLWPLFHLQTEKVRFLRGEWETYETVNQRFAEATAQTLDGNPGVVWFQDYHFATAPAMLREIAPKATILQFWHIPWPPWEIFRQHPERRALLEGLLGCDLIGMHIDLYCRNFLECVTEELRLPVDAATGNILLGDRIVRVRALPISVDVAAFDTLARSDRTLKRMEEWRKRVAPQGQCIGLGVERGDYTKGILLRLRAIDHFFTLHPEWRERFTFVQVTPASRESIPAYALYQKEMTRMVREINSRHGNGPWQPVILIRTALSTADLVALYRIADVTAVSVRYDGMNLVAKEYIAARADELGTLILSEFAGAAGELPQAMVINPYDVEVFASTLDRALHLPEEEQRNRMRQMRTHLASNSIYDWVEDVLEEIAAVDRDPQGVSGPLPVLDHLEEIGSRLQAQQHIELFCDYDGVLTPIAARPQDALINDNVRQLIEKLRDSASVHVTVISGRALTDLTELVSVERLTYAGNHGLEISGPRAQRIHPDAGRVHGLLQHLYVDLRSAMRAFPGVLVENKQLGVSLHYRLAPPEQVPAIVNIFHASVQRANRDGSLRITSGKRVLEVRPNVPWDKGRAVLWLLEVIHGRNWRGNVLPIYLGDDETDEDAFRALGRRGLTIVVGNPPPPATAARYRLESVHDVTVFLEWLIRSTS